MARIEWIDNLKAWTITMVVMGHMMSCEAFGSTMGAWCYEHLIIPFHMPLFAVLSGWFFKPRNEAGTSWAAFLSKKCRTILLPYLVWCVVWFFVRPLAMTCLDGGALHLSSVVWQARFLLSDGIMRYGWWFLRALFLCHVVAYLSGRHLWLSALGVASLALTGILPNMPEKDSLLKGFVYLYPFFVTGWWLRRWESHLEPKPWLLAASVLTYGAMLLAWQPADSFYAMNTSALAPAGAGDIVGMTVVWKTLWRYLVGTVGSVMFLLLAKRLAARPMGLFSAIGRETLGIYLLQSVVYWSLPKHDILGLGEGATFLVALLVSAGILVMAFYVVDFSSRNRWTQRLLWGKWT